MINVEPHTSKTIEPSRVGETEFGECVDDQTLDATHVRRGTEPVVDVQDRVADELAGPVIRDVPTALDRNQFGPHISRFAAQVRRQVGTRPIGEYVWMFEQQQVLSAAVL